MKKILIPILFLAILLNSCADVTVDTDDTVAPIDTAILTVLLDTKASYESLSQAETETEPESEPKTEQSEEKTTESSEIIPETTEAAPASAQVTDNKNLIYLTFDDGPGKYTERVLEILSEYDVPATFFMVGRFMRNNSDKVRAVHDAGHLIGCHSVMHDYRAIYENADSITADIEEWEDIFLEITGEEVTERLYRFPGGSTCSAIEEDGFFELHEAVTGLGYRSFDWTCANNDLWLGDKGEDEPMEEYMKRSLMESLKRGGQPKILLLHESVEGTVEMLPWIIEYIRDEGYEFAPLAEYGGEYLFSH